MIDITLRPASGRDLKTLRVYLDVRQRDLASAWGVTRQRITSVEALHRPTDQVIDRYLAALAKVNGHR